MISVSWWGNGSRNTELKGLPEMLRLSGFQAELDKSAIIMNPKWLNMALGT